MGGKREKSTKKDAKEKTKDAKPATDSSDFPRGGANGLTPLEFREIARQAEHEVLFSDGVTSGQIDNKRKHVGVNKETKTRPRKLKKADADTAGTGNGAADIALGDDERVCQVESLSFKRLAKGALVFGMVSAIHELELRVSLPNGLIGFVPITSVSPELTALVEKAAEADEDSETMDVDTEDDDTQEDALDLNQRFFIGQFVKCAIVDIASSKPGKKSKAARVELTLMPAEINSRIDPDDICEGLIITSSVKSVEDRGYVLNTGIPGAEVTAFLPAKSAQAWIDRWTPETDELKPGQLVEAAVTSVSDDKRSLRLSIDPTVVSQATPKETHKTMASAQPGQLVSATVLKIWDRGLSLRFMGFYDCCADLGAIGMLAAGDKTEIGEKYTLGSTIQVRIAYVSLTAAAKVITVSVLPHVLALNARPGLTGYETPAAARLASNSKVLRDNDDDDAIPDKHMWPIPYGTILEDCVVAGTVGSIGLVLRVSESDAVTAFVLASQLVNEDQQKPALHKHSGQFHIGTRHRARVIGYDAIDAVVRVSLRPSVVGEQLFTIDGVRPGAVVSGTVVKFKENGVEVALSPNLNGFVHKQDMSDITLKHPELHFAAGKKINCRVLRVISEQHSILLTARKSLVQSKLPVVTGYGESEGAVAGATTHGVVDRVLKGGDSVIVWFYQGVSALVVKCSKQLAPGKVIKCRLLSSDPAKRRILATANVDPDVPLSELILQAEATKPKRAEFSTDTSQVSIGQIVSGTVVSVGDAFAMVLLDGSLLGAALPVGHFSDHVGVAAEKLAAGIKVNAQLDEVVITGINSELSRVTVSAKPALIKAGKAGRIPSSTAEITAGKTLVGWVSGLTTFGAFVAFSGTASALAPLEHLSDRYVSAPEDLLSVNQTVIAFVTSVEDSVDGKRVRVSLKHSAVDISATDCVQPVDFVAQYFESLEGPHGSALLEEIGRQAQVKVKQRHPYGVVVSPISGSNIIPTEASGFITAEQAKDRIDECAEGAVVAACVLDVDPEKSIIDYSLRKPLVADDSGKTTSKSKAKAKAEAKANAAAVSHKALEKAVHKQQRTQAVVEVVKEDYLVLSLPLLGNAIAFAMAKSYNDRTKPFMRFKIGQSLRCTPVRVASNRRTLVLLQSPSGSAASREVDNVEQRAVKEPVDPAINFFEDYQPGLITQARVRSIKGMQANLDLATNVKGRLHITELVDEDFKPSAKTSDEVFASAGVQPGSTIQVRVLGLHDANVYKFLPITHRASPMKAVIETTIRPSQLEVKAEEIGTNPLSWKTVKAGQVLHGFVKSVKNLANRGNSVVMVALGVSLVGHLQVLDATGDYDVAAHPTRYFTAGMPIEVQVSCVDKKNRIVFVVPHGGPIAGITAPIASLEELLPGVRVVVSVAAIMQHTMFADIRVVGESPASRSSGSHIQRVNGKISAFDSADTLNAEPFSAYTKGQLVEAVILDGGHGSDLKTRKVQLSVRPSALQKDIPASGIADPSIASAADVSVGQVVRGFIKSITEVGCFVSLGRALVARVLISELSDEYVRDVKSVFAAGKFVTGIVTSVDVATNRVGLSLRPSKVGTASGPDGEKKRRLDQIGVGESLRGTVTRIEDYGVFVRPDDAFTTGLCYVREIADSEGPIHPKALYEIGDRVLAKVLKVDVASDRLALGLKSSYFAAAAQSSDYDSANEDVTGDSDDEADESDESDGNASEVSEDEDTSNASEVSEDEDTGNASDDGMDVDEGAANPALAVSGGFRWGDDDEATGANPTKPSGDAQAASSNDASDDEGGSETRGTSKKSKRQSKMQRLAHDVTAELSEQAPRSANDFERLVMGSPNSSFVWIQFMTFYLGQSEVAQARQVAERALKTISPREEQEKMNVWMALLNLEHRFGSSDTLDAVLKRAIQFMNPKHVYLQMANVHERAAQFADAERMHKLALAKFPGSCKVWVLFGLFYLKQSKVAESRDLLARALRSLPDRKHVKAISQFAQMEFKHGEPERGRTVLEGVLASFPKRVDLWSVYLDMEISAAVRANAAAAATRRWAPVRGLFERVIAMKLSSKKIKSFFKKWLKFEKDHGSEATMEHVKQRAREYVGSMAA
ncbi:rRNA biogenesis protein rrp5 [Coemansia sp. RSA 988]|nr:rRNA biogenesis protein rrp5 [Coemansia sp. RSA 988]